MANKKLKDKVRKKGKKWRKIDEGWLNPKTQDMLRIRPNYWKSGGYDVILSDTPQSLHGKRLKNVGSKDKAVEFVKKYINK